MARFLPIVLAGLCIGIAPLSAVVPAAQARQQNPSGTDRLSDADLEEMLAPIALYPDPLLANVLAASVYPNQLAEAKSVVGNDAAIDAKDWEPSVKAIAKIPDAMTMLTEYPDWTKALGEAFILQSQDVMNAVQRLRARAQANGALQTTEQQVVQTQGDTIIIQPAQPNVIYVPTYSPQVVYVDSSPGNTVAAGVIGFGLGVAAGAIIANNMDCNWYGGGCCYGCGWGWGGGYHGGNYNGGGNTKIKIDTGGGDINIGSGNNNNIGNRPGGGQGEKWKPNQDKMSNSLREGKSESLGNYKNSGKAGANTNAKIPNRQAGSQPIADRPAPKASNNNRAGSPGGEGVKAPARPSAQPTQRPADMQARGSGPKASKPSIPPASARPPASNASKGGGGYAKSPSARPATPSTSRPSAYGGGGNKAQSSSRGASSRGSGGASRSSGGGGGGSRGGGGGGRGR